jgi:hypothetical protein
MVEISKQIQRVFAKYLAIRVATASDQAFPLSAILRTPDFSTQCHRISACNPMQEIETVFTRMLKSDISIAS